MKETVDFVINEICDRLKPEPLLVLPSTVPLSEPGCCLPLGLFTPVDKCSPGYADESWIYVEAAIDSLAQKGSICGIHMILVTKHLTEDVITGIVRENIPSRIAFAVSSRKESQLVLGRDGAEKLIGQGDMLYCPAGTKDPLRVQGAYVSDEEVDRVAEYVKKQAEKYPMD